MLRIEVDKLNKMSFKKDYDESMNGLYDKQFGHCFSYCFSQQWLLTSVSLWGSVIEVFLSMETLWTKLEHS